MDLLKVLAEAVEKHPSVPTCRDFPHPSPVFTGAGLRSTHKYDSLLNALGAQPTTAYRQALGRNKKMSPYQCAPQGKQIRELCI